MPGKIPAKETKKSQKPLQALALWSVANSGVNPRFMFPVIPAFPASLWGLSLPPSRTL